jgi:hypothetical protein
MARKHNIGFRCAVGVCDLVLTRPAAAELVEDAAACEAPVEVGA